MRMDTSIFMAFVSGLFCVSNTIFFHSFLEYTFLWLFIIMNDAFYLSRMLTQ